MFIFYWPGSFSISNYGNNLLLKCGLYHISFIPFWLFCFVTWFLSLVKLRSLSNQHGLCNWKLAYRGCCRWLLLQKPHRTVFKQIYFLKVIFLNTFRTLKCDFFTLFFFQIAAHMIYVISCVTMSSNCPGGYYKDQRVDTVSTKNNLSFSTLSGIVNFN